MRGPLNINLNQNSPLPQNNFSKVFRSFHFVARVFGLLSFSVTYDANDDFQNARITIFDLLWLTLSISVYSFSIWFYQDQLLLSRLLSVKRLGILILCHDVLAILQLSFQIISVVLDVLNRNRIVDILKLFTSFNNGVRSDHFYFVLFIIYFNQLNQLSIFVKIIACKV